MGTRGTVGNKDLVHVIDALRQNWRHVTYEETDALCTRTKTNVLVQSNTTLCTATLSLSQPEDGSIYNLTALRSCSTMPPTPTSPSTSVSVRRSDTAPRAAARTGSTTSGRSSASRCCSRKVCLTLHERGRVQGHSLRPTCEQDGSCVFKLPDAPLSGLWDLYALCTQHAACMQATWCIHAHASCGTDCGD